MQDRRAILWFRNDLRLHDNEALVDALQLNSEVIPVYVMDTRLFQGKTPLGYPKLGAFRKKFLLEALHDLRVQLRNRGSDLYVREGLPETIIPAMAQELKTSSVYCNRERTREEVVVQDEMEKNLWSIGQEMRYYRGKMLFHTADLPFPVTHCPDTFTAFRKEVEKYIEIRKPFPIPEKLNPPLITLDSGTLPEVVTPTESRGEHHIELYGGEGKGLQELSYYLEDTHLVKNYYNSRNGLLGRDFSSKFSPYLAHGCLSPKYIYAQLKDYEEKHGSNKSTYWLFFELMWRDYFRFIAKKYGNKIFLKTGIKEKIGVRSFDNRTLFEKWTSGETGVPFVDANMKELNATGFMSNRGRQNVASFLVNDLEINWLWGAEYFESQLIDYDPCSNYGNWNYIARVGCDPRQDRYFNIPMQAKNYDPEADYMKYWLPQLKDAPLEFMFNPFSMDREEINVSGHYPPPCIDVKNWHS